MGRLVGKDEMILKGVEMLMNPDKKEKLSFGHPYRFQNDRLKALQGVPFEKVGVYFKHDGGVWQFSNVTRREGYELNANSKTPLPTRINEAQFIEAFNKISTALGEKVCFNLIIVKEPRKVNYRVVYMEINPIDVWCF